MGEGQELETAEFTIEDIEDQEKLLEEVEEWREENIEDYDEDEPEPV
jgi:hypothetical protein